MSTPELTPAEEDRYSRQMGPGLWDVAAQRRLKAATVFITRVGGMGGPAAMALAMAGVGRIIIAHGGCLISPDLNRQCLGAEETLDQPRAGQFAARLRALNRFVTVEAIDREPGPEEASALARQADVMLSCAPTFAERLQLNAAAVAAGKPLIDAAQWGMSGTLVAVQPRRTACLRCIYPRSPEFEEFFPVVGAISMALGSLAALEAVKILTGAGRPNFGRLWTIDGARGYSSFVELSRDPACTCCGERQP